MKCKSVSACVGGRLTDEQTRVFQPEELLVSFVCLPSGWEIASKVKYSTPRMGFGTPYVGLSNTYVVELNATEQGIHRMRINNQRRVLLNYLVVKATLWALYIWAATATVPCVNIVRKRALEVLNTIHVIQNAHLFKHSADPLYKSAFPRAWQTVNITSHRFFTSLFLFLSRHSVPKLGAFFL